MDELFSLRLRELRKNIGLTQMQLSEISGVRQDLICLYERGKTYPKLTSLVKLASSLNTSLDYLTGITEDPVSVAELKELLSENELELLRIYRGLSCERQERALGYMQGLSDKN